MPTRTWAPGSPEYLYHVYDDPIVTAAFTKARKMDIVGPGGGVDPKWVFSLKKDMDALRAYGQGLGIVDPVASIGTADPDNNELMVLKVGTGTAHPVLVVGCHHAREWISVEIPYLVAEYLIRKWTNNPTTPQEKRIKHLLLNRQITFIPMVNPNGHRHTVRTERNWRANRKTYTAPSAALPSTRLPNAPLSAPQYGGAPARDIRYPNGAYTGVDINRNYSTAHWGQETSGTSRDPRNAGSRPGTTTLGRMTWCGPAAGSETETQLMMGLGAFQSVITYHNYWEVFFYPDAAVGNVFVEWVGNGLVGLIAASPGGHPYRFWNNSSTVDPDNYLTTGELIDYAYQQAPGRPAFTPELRPTLDDPNGWGFSLLPESEIEPTFLENLPAALGLINCAGHNAVAAPHSATQNTASPPSKVQLVRHCWQVFQGWTP